MCEPREALEVEFARALEFHRRGELAEAEQICKSILHVDARNFELITYLAQFCWSVVRSNRLKGG